MCGRYSLTLQGMKVVRDELADVRIQLRTLQPRYNIAPGQLAPVFRLDGGTMRIATLRWGLIPSWARDAKFGFQCVNARAETVASKPAFRSAFRKRRCRVPADGFYEWQPVGGRKQPWYFARPDGDLLEFAGLWESWSPPDGGPPVETFTLCTTTPNAVAAPIHDRMPVILSAQDATIWTDPEASPEALCAVLRPAPDDLLARYPVSPVVNNARNDIPECVIPLSTLESGPDSH